MPDPRVPAPPARRPARGAHVVALPLRTRFRGIDVREAMLVEGPNGWTEFCPFVEYDDAEAAAWLAAAIDFGWGPDRRPAATSIPVNATLPAVARRRGRRRARPVPRLPHREGEGGRARADPRRRRRPGAAARELRRRRRAASASTPTRLERRRGRARRSTPSAPFDLEYVEQPCATVAELAELRAARHDWACRSPPTRACARPTDPLAVARAGAADLLVIKAQPLGGRHRRARHRRRGRAARGRVERPRHLGRALRWARTSPPRSRSSSTTAASAPRPCSPPT